MGWSWPNGNESKLVAMVMDQIRKSLSVMQDRSQHGKFKSMGLIQSEQTSEGSHSKNQKSHTPKIIRPIFQILASSVTFDECIEIKPSLACTHFETVNRSWSSYSN
jgi:hypothetical protein